MITAYHRPISLEEAFKLVSQPGTCPMGGGTMLNQNTKQDFEVVDLQDLGLDKVLISGNNIKVGAAVKLQSLFDSTGVPGALKTTIGIEKTLNLRNMSTVAGSIITGDGRSPLLNMLLALDAELLIYPNNEHIKLGDFLPLRDQHSCSKLITEILIPRNIKSAFEYVARTPSDKPIICASLAWWQTGRIRLVIGGWGNSPSIATDSSLQPSENITFIQQAAQNAAHDAADEWAGKEYRKEVARILAMRCVENIIQTNTD